MKQKIIRITTVPISLEKLLSGQLQFMNYFYQVVAVSSERENLEKLGKTQGIDVFPLEMTRKITPLKDILAVVKLFLFLKKTKPFIVHSHTPKAGIVGMLAAKLAGVPHRLHTVAGLPLLESRGLKRKVLDMVEKLTYVCATKVYPNSFGLNEIIIQNKYCSSSKLKVLANGSSNGIDTAYFNSSNFSEKDIKHLKMELDINSSDFIFIFVGRLVTDKGINELIQAFIEIQNNRNELKLLLVGPYEQDLNPLRIETLNQIKNNKSIICVGYKNDVRPYLAIANCLVFPSYREGFPNVVMQAGAMDLPCIVSDINGCNEIILDNLNGIIIPPKDREAIKKSMLKIYNNKNLYSQIRQKARLMIVSRFDQKMMWQTILDEYSSLETKCGRK